MSVQRSCQPCREARAKCDRARPSCGRCRHRGIACYGAPESVFLNQNETARKNSERARRRYTDDSPGAHNPTPLPMPMPMPIPERLIQSEIVAPSTSKETNAGNDMAEDFPWLSKEAIRNVPEPVKRNLETRAVERFFVNWVLHPRNDGISPGHLQDLPVLYMGAPPLSVLSSAVEALAYAELGNKRGSANTPFRVRARTAYGTALTRLRTLASDEQKVANDRVLAAILLIDNFEGIHLNRTEPLGPHADIVRHILEARGNVQFYSGHSFALWRIAHHRLQARQIFLRVGPDPIQEQWIRNLNTSRPDIPISADVLHMNIYCAAVRKLVQDTSEISQQWQQHADRLVATIHEFLNQVNHWTSKLSGSWKAKQTDPQTFLRPPGFDSNEAHLLLPNRAVHTFHDKWLAYMWNFHSASQIVLRESLIELLESIAKLQHDPLHDQEQDIQNQQISVVNLSADIVGGLPTLLGFTDDVNEEAVPPQRGRLTGRFFCLFSVWVLQRARFTPQKDKGYASRVAEWIKSSHEFS